jgi:paraquat-inducible protein B
VRRSRGISLVWLIPIVAAAIAGWLAWTTYAQQGPQIRISFESAEGLEAGKTKITYRNVDIGTVETVRLSPDLKRIVVTARLEQDANPFLTTGTRYWIVRPRVGTGGVSGLGTLVSGAYIEVDPGPGDYTREFTGLEEPPEIRSNVPGRNFVLRADSLGSLGRGAPIYYRGIEAGQVLGYELAPDQREALKINIFVQAPYDQLVHEQSRFWNASGLSVATDGGGLKVHMASVQALLVGGVEFETPTSAGDNGPAPADTEFALYPDADTAAQSNAGRRLPFLVEFDGSARGLKTGAPVEIRGIRVGSVTDVRLAYSREREGFVIQATVEVEPERIRAVDADTGKPVTTAAMPVLVGRGLRAQLQTGNFLTGDLYVDLDFHPNVPEVPMHQVNGIDVIPSVPTQLETIQASATEVLQKFAALPLPELVQSLTNTAKSVEATIASPDTKDAIDNLNRSMSSLRGTIESLNQQSGPLIGSLKVTSDAASATLKQAQATLEAVQRTFGPNTQLVGSIQALIGELDSAARSVRGLSDYLERHPEAILRGKSGGY